MAPPRCDAMLRYTVETAPTQRVRQMQTIAEQGRMDWQRTSGYKKRAGVERQIARWGGVLGEGLRFHPDQGQATEAVNGALVLNRMLDLQRPNSLHVVWSPTGLGQSLA